MILLFYGHISPAVASLRDWWAINCQSRFDWATFLSRCPVAEGLAGPVYDLEFDGKGLVDMDFRRVDYDVAAELQLAKDLKLPYFEVYYESLVNGIHHTHHQEFLRELAQKEGFDRELDAWLKSGND